MLLTRTVLWTYCIRLYTTLLKQGLDDFLASPIFRTYFYLPENTRNPQNMLEKFVLLELFS